MNDAHAAVLALASEMAGDDPDALEWIVFTKGDRKTYAAVSEERDAGCSLASTLFHDDWSRTSDRLGEIVRRVRRARRREAEISAHLIDGMAPDWAHDVHTLLADAIGSCGGDLAMLLPGPDAEDRRRMLCLAIDPARCNGIETRAGVKHES